MAERNAHDLHFAVMRAHLSVAGRHPAFNDHPEFAMGTPPLNSVDSLEHEIQSYFSNYAQEACRSLTSIASAAESTASEEMKFASRLASLEVRSPGSIMQR